MDEVTSILNRVRYLASRYHRLTGRPLGVTGEVAEYTAVEALGLERAQVRQAGYDALRRSRGKVTKIQIKSRCVLDPKHRGQRLGSISLKHPWDSVLLVVLDQDLRALEMYEAPRSKVVRELRKPGSKARNERGALSVSQFRRISQRVWPRGSVRANA